MEPGEMTPAEAANALGVGRMYVYELLLLGRIKGRKVMGRWLISRKSVVAYRRDHSRPGRREREASNASR